MAHQRGWDCAFVLASSYATRLTPAQHVACVVTTMRDPDRSPLELIALACQVIGRHA